MEQAPHRVVDNMVGGIFKSIEDLARSGVNSIRSAGKNLIKTLDTPVQDITGKEGPIYMVDRVADGIVDAGTNFIEDGVIDSAKKAKEGAMKAMDHPVEELGFPPKLGGFKLFKRG